MLEDIAHELKLERLEPRQHMNNNDHELSMAWVPAATLVELRCEDCQLICYPLLMDISGTEDFLTRHNYSTALSKWIIARAMNIDNKHRNNHDPML